MCFRQSLCILFASSLALLAQSTPAVGSGAPTPAVQADFINAYYRNNFAYIAGFPPLGNVKKLGSTGYVQEFPDAANTPGVKYALVRANLTPPVVPTAISVFQMYPALYTYYVSLGTTTVGYPISDTRQCPYLVNQPGAACQEQVMDKPAVLFVYSNTTLSATQFYIVDPFFTRWQALGGAYFAGPATSNQQTVTSSFMTTATLQTFDQSAIFSITSGNLSGHLIAVGPAVNNLYFANNGYTGFLGFPTTEELIQPDGSRRQNFEGGAISYVPGSPAVLRYPVSAISIVPNAAVKMNLGDTLTVQAYLLDPNGNPLTDRTVVWSTSNSRIVTVQGSGYTASVKAVGGGGANIQATSEGKVSSPLSIFVTAPCCDIGAGAPTPAIQQAFQDAVTRNKLSLRLPVPTAVRRAGTGYVQDVQDAATGAPYLIAVADGSLAGYVLGGALLASYNDLGGPSGSLGYPVSDATTGGRQLFANQAALAGNPVQMVAGPFLAKWAALSYETGAAGSPTSAVVPALSFRATTGQTQSFKSGAMFMATSGPSAGSVYFVGGLIAAAYTQAGGIAGGLGFPAGDEYTSAGKRRQDFEGGFIDYAAGDAVAQVHPGNRQPIVQATPSSVVAGSRVRLAVGGFDAGSTVRVSITGQPDFVVTTVNGAYAWQSNVAVNAKSGAIQIHAADTNSGAAADGSYSVRAVSEVSYRITKSAGDGQAGPPGAVLPQAFVILVSDDAGNPAPGMTVSWAASPGSVIAAASAVTDANGQALAFLRLPPSDGIALATAEVAHQSVTFSAQSVHSGLSAFPAMTQAINAALGNGTGTIFRDGALLASVAAILRYYQNSSALPSPNGFADPSTLNQFLTGYCLFDTKGGQVCDGFIPHPDTGEQFVNLWRLGAFVGGNLDVSIEKADLNTVRDWIAQGAPLVLELAMSLNGTYAGAHYVVATGIGADGSIAIMDPNPAFGKANLNDYLAGFATSSAQWKGTLDQVVRLVPRAPVTAGFLVAGKTPVMISSPAGVCGTALKLHPSVGQAPWPAAGPPAGIFASRCDGSDELYQLDVPSQPNTAFQLTFTDLGSPANRADLAGAGNVSFKVFQSGAVWIAAAQDLTFTPAGVVNAASFTPDLAPGSLFSVFGSGMSGPGGTTTVEIGGRAATVLAQTPFQVNGQVPPDLAPGALFIKVVSPYGLVEQSIVIQPTAPAIFVLGTSQAAIINNQNAALNTAGNPLNRGDVLVVFCTGLGTTGTQGQFHPATTPVTVLLGGAALQPAFAGLTPGFIGLYQVNVPVPLSTPPGLDLPLQLRQGAVASNTVSVSVQ